jgi:hypothetical protein
MLIARAIQGHCHHLICRGLLIRRWKGGVWWHVSHDVDCPVFARLSQISSNKIINENYKDTYERSRDVNVIPAPSCWFTAQITLLILDRWIGGQVTWLMRLWTCRVSIVENRNQMGNWMNKRGRVNKRNKRGRSQFSWIKRLWHLDNSFTRLNARCTNCKSLATYIYIHQT